MKISLSSLGVAVERVLILLLVLLAQSSSPAWQPQQASLVIRHVTIIDATGSPARPGMTIVITGDRISAIGQDGKIAIPKRAQVTDGSGKFLIPGLWDMHVHLSMAGETTPPLFIANGITSVRDMGGDFATVKALREKIASGAIVGPRIKAAGPILESPRFIRVIEELTGRSWKDRIGVADAADAREAVDSLVALGVDFVKIRTNASHDSYLAIAAEAKRAGMQLVGHPPERVTLIEASDAGQRSFEHLFIFDQGVGDVKETSQRLVKNGAWLVPTLAARRTATENDVAAALDDRRGVRDPRRKYLSPDLSARWRSAAWLWKTDNPPLDWKSLQAKAVERLRVMIKAGVRVMAGTDIPAPLVYPGFGLHEELEQLVKDAGLTPLEALQSATRGPAEFFNMSDSLGTIENRKIADLVLLDANPLEDIRNTRSINAVVQNGKLIPKAGIQQILDQVAANNLAGALAEEARVILIDPKIYDAYVGRYEITPTWRVFITKEDNRLMCVSGRLPKFELYPENETTFSPKVIDARVTFVKDAAGTVNQILMQFRGKDNTGNRMQ